MQLGLQLPADALKLPAGPIRVPAGTPHEMAIPIERAALPCGQFTGAIHWVAGEGGARLKVPVELKVRTGPFWPIAVLLAGILLGHLVKFMQERGKPLADSLAKVNRLAFELESADPGDRALLEPQLEDVRRDVYREELDGIDASLGALAARAEALAELRRIEARIAGNQYPAAMEARKKIALARERLGRGEDATALVAAVREDLGKLRTGLMRGGAAPPAELEEALGACETLGEAAGRARAAAVQAPPPAWPRLRRVLAWVSGFSDVVRAEATLWLARPLLYVVLVVGLVAVGLDTLYVQNGATFGARPFADFLGLFLWGLSADVASRTLSNLKGAS